MILRVKTIPKLMFEIRPSIAFPGQVGTFAVRAIRRGEIISEVDSPEEVVYLHAKDVKKLDPITRRSITRFCVKDEDDEYCVPADLNNIGSSWYFNHSCDSNVAYDKKGNFIAIRDIKKDEELSLDYGRMFTDSTFKMRCACGNKNCRKIITGKDWLDPKFRTKNKSLMWPEMRK